MSLSHFSNIQLGKVIKKTVVQTLKMCISWFFSLFGDGFISFDFFGTTNRVCCAVTSIRLVWRFELNSWDQQPATPHVSRWHTEKFVRSFRFRSESVRFGVFRQSCLSFVDLDSVWDLRIFVVSGQSLWSVLQTNGRGGQVVDYVDVSNG